MSDNPYTTPFADAENGRSLLRLIGRWAVYLAVVLLLVALLLPARRGAREPALRNGCMSNLRQVVYALQAYESEHGSLPPAYTVDAEGNRLHSWRTLILPYIEESQLFQKIDLSKPWDDPANADARRAVVNLYSCPSAMLEEGMTTYFGVVGPNAVFSGSVGRNLSEITDRLEDTIVVIDGDPDQAVHWMSPQDITADKVLSYGSETNTNHPGLIVAAFLDGHATPLPLNSAADDLRAMLTIAGRETKAD
jgi:hypothetical protein